MACFPDRSSPDARFNQQGPGRRPGAYCAPRATPGAASYYLPRDLPAALFATLRPRLAVAFLLLLRAVFLAAGRLYLLPPLRTVLTAGLRAAPPLTLSMSNYSAFLPCSTHSAHTRGFRPRTATVSWHLARLSHTDQTYPRLRP